jgi:hypothetical protein
MAQPALVNFSNAISFAENLVNGAPQLSDADIIFAAPDSGFGGGERRLSRLLTQDTVSVRNQGAGAGQIALISLDVTYGGQVIGTLGGGAGAGAGAALTIALTALATAASVDVLIQNVTDAAGCHCRSTPRSKRRRRGIRSARSRIWAAAATPPLPIWTATATSIWWSGAIAAI